MFKKCVLSLLILVPGYSNAIKDNTAYGVTATAGFFGAWFGKTLANEHSSHSGDALVGAAFFGAAGAGLTYWYLRDKMPAARYEKAKQIIDKINNKNLIKAPNIIESVQTKFANQSYPLVAGTDYLGRLLPEVKRANQLLKWARADTPVQKRYNGNLLLDQIGLAQSESKACKLNIQERLSCVKLDSNYRAQDEAAYNRRATDTHLELLRKGANAQQLAAEAAHVSAQANQTAADAKSLDSTVNFLDWFVGRSR